MTDPDAITPEEAAEILGISRESSAPQVERAYAEKLETLEKKVAQAATAALRNKYRLAVDRLKLARETLERQDAGSDLPSLELSPTDTLPPPPAMAANAPAPAATTIPVVVPATAGRPARGKSPLLKIAAIVLGIAVVGVAAWKLLADKPTAVYAGDYRKRILFETTVFDYSVTVAKDGTLQGTNQVADKSLKPVVITGKVDDKGVITAKGDDHSEFGGTIKGNVMELEEKFSAKKSVFYSLTKGMALPADPPQAKFAGTYHEPVIKYPNGTRFEYEFTIAGNGDLTGSCNDLENGSKTRITGHVGTRGKVTGEAPLGNGRKTSYSGTVDGDLITLDETLSAGKVFSFTISKGAKTKAPRTPPAAPAGSALAAFAGDYRKRISYPTVVFDYSLTVAADGTIKGTNQAADHSANPVAITGKVNADGTLQAQAGGVTEYTGTIAGDDMKLSEKLSGGKVLGFTLTKGITLPADPPQAEFAGAYQNRSVTDPNGKSWTYTFALAKTGKVAGSYRSSDGATTKDITGSVDMVGRITAKSAAFANGKQTTYAGKAAGGTLELEETTINGKTFGFKLPRTSASN